MKITRQINKTYDIDEEILLDYINYCKENHIIPEFNDFTFWLDEQYYLEDLLGEEDGSWEYVNDSFNIDKEFKKEIDKLNND